MDLTQVNYLAVLITTMITMVLGFLWYSPVLFGNTWLNQIGLKKEEMSGGSPLTYILTALTALVGSFVLALLLTMMKETTMMSGMIVGLLIGVSISVKIGMNFLFESRTIGLYFITIGYHLVTYLIAGIIIGAMQ
ncbi:MULTISPECIES: DUF1761 domain-containing protein [Bacillaceae]|uniref:Dolichyl-phosphate-mannose--protein O-mannosyl transferase n=1 Tax=Peribacillus huizhouensis TaxID=1501239 RepID=A0ABR6CPB7_9BACI|nr:MULTISPECIES: DUF1761 domain-containing protein [Bacillaceae]MBA9026771.1 dolichyl-phosphate-mannose--protein O-mannosyl transferase [Peribacillus huizhouensis]